MLGNEKQGKFESGGGLERVAGREAGRAGTRFVAVEFQDV